MNNDELFSKSLYSKRIFHAERVVSLVSYVYEEYSATTLEMLMSVRYGRLIGAMMFESMMSDLLLFFFHFLYENYRLYYELKEI